MPRNFSELKNGGTIPMLSPTLKSGGTRPPRPPPIDARACTIFNLERVFALFKWLGKSKPVATREVKTYNFTARLRPFPRFAETISQGVLAQRGC